MLKLKISYENTEEKDKVMYLLKPVLKGAKIKNLADKKPYMKAYITVNNLKKDL